MRKPEASFEEACRDVATQIAETVISKQHDYGHQNILAFREKGLVVRLTDKLERFNNESIEGGTLEGVEGGLRYDLFDHDDPEDLSCICDLPQHAQDLLWNDIDQSENAESSVSKGYL